jgi:predicted nucleic acid-binding protein
MPVVSDTSPILGLSAIGCLDLLQDQFETVFIPQSVLAELKVETDFRGTDAIQQALSQGWLQSREIQNKPLARSLSLELHKGEAEAITLAMDLGLDMIVMDERIGREHAKALGLKTVGVLGVLLNAKKHGKLNSVDKAMKALRRGIGFFISERLYEEILKQAGESE